MSWVSDLLGIHSVYVDNVLVLPERKAIDFREGGGITIDGVDDPATGRTRVTISSSAFTQFASGFQLKWDSSPTGTPVHAMIVDSAEQLIIGASGVNGVQNMLFDIKGVAYQWLIQGVVELALSTSGLFTNNRLIDSGSGGFTTTGVIKQGTPLPTTGSYRVKHNWSLIGRDNANANDRFVLAWGDAVTGNDGILLGDGSNALNQYSSGVKHDFYVGATLEASLTATALDLQNNNLVTTGFVSIGAAPATVGALRLESEGGIYGRTSNKRIARISASDNLVLGHDAQDSSTPANVIIGVATSGALQLRVAGVVEALFNANVLDLHNGLNTNFAIRGNAEAMLGFNIAASGVRNLAMFNDGSAGMNAMDGGVFFANSVAAPTGNPTAGVYKYVTSGAGIGRGTGGTVTTYIPA